MAQQKKRQAPPATITIVEAARRLRIGRNQAYAAAHSGQLPAIKIGRRYLVPIAALDRMLSGEAAKKTRPQGAGLFASHHRHANAGQQKDQTHVICPRNPSKASRRAF